MDCSTRPSNVRVCQFRHLGTINGLIILMLIMDVNTFML